MSAFIVEDKTINEIIAFLHLNQQRMGYAGIARLIQKAGYDIEQNEEEWKHLADDMFWTNCVAVDERYGVGEAQTFRELNFKYLFSPKKGTNAIQAFASLRCWRYQCSEGDVPETSDVFKLMDKVCDVMAHAIVSDMPEYKATRWG